MSVDPRIGQELEKLNNSCEKINNLEVNLGKGKKLLFMAFWRLSTHTPDFSIFFDPKMNSSATTRSFKRRVKKRLL